MRRIALAFVGVVTVLGCSVAAKAQVQSRQPGGVDAFKQTVGSGSFDKLVARLGEVNSDIITKGLKRFPGSTGRLLTGYPYNEYYDWDLYFENIYLTYYGVSDYCFTNLKMFLKREDPDGYISRSLIKNRDRQDFKPFLAQLALMGSRLNGNNFDWMRDDAYDKLAKYVNHWFDYDYDHNGLPVWISADAAGMDNEWSRGGPLNSFQDEGVDLACELVRETQAMAVIADMLGKPYDAKAFNARADKLTQLINDVFWDDKDGFYYDRNEKTGKSIKVKSIAGFFPLWAGVAPPNRAKRLIQEHLLNEKEFWLKYPIATYAKTEVDYYQGGNNECNWRGSSWMPMNYIIFHGLIHYGYQAIARDLAYRCYHLALDENPHTREWFDAETGAGQGHVFWGFSTLGYIMPLEWETQYDPMELHKDVKAIVPDSFGVKFPALPPN